jgi:mandelate racemase
VAEAHGLPLSSHFFPEISAHLMCVTPTAHWLEFLEWASPILTEPVRQENGVFHLSERPGSGVDWDEAAISRYEVRIG